MKIDIRHMVLTISNAVDLVGVSDVFHGRRVGMMAAECAKTLGWGRTTELRLFECGLLHDCGVSSTREHHSLVQEFEWPGNNAHCATGHDYCRPLHHWRIWRRSCAITTPARRI